MAYRHKALQLIEAACLTPLLSQDFHALTSGEVDSLLTVADAVGYRKPSNATGSRGRYFHAYMARQLRSETRPRWFVQFRAPGCKTETVDEFVTIKEARAMLAEYRQVGGGEYWLASKPCKAWGA